MTPSLAYYNENDPFAAQWLRNLIAKNLVLAGFRAYWPVSKNAVTGFVPNH